MKKYLLILLVFISFNLIFADSPITSTNFSDAYNDVKIIGNIAPETTMSRLTKEHLEYLDSDYPIDYKIALINRVGWGHSGKKTNYDLFFTYLMNKYGYQNLDDLLSKASSDRIIALAYLKIINNGTDENGELSDKLDMEELADATRISEVALKKNPKSYTINIIHALIIGQKYLGSDWGKVSILAEEVNDDGSLNMDMRGKAISIIFDYMNEYQEYEDK